MRCRSCSVGTSGPLGSVLDHAPCEGVLHLAAVDADDVRVVAVKAPGVVAVHFQRPRTHPAPGGGLGYRHVRRVVVRATLTPSGAAHAIPSSNVSRYGMDSSMRMGRSSLSSAARPMAPVRACCSHHERTPGGAGARSSRMYSSPSHFTWSPCK